MHDTYPAIRALSRLIRCDDVLGGEEICVGTGGEEGMRDVHGASGGPPRLGPPGGGLCGLLTVR